MENGPRPLALWIGNVAGLMCVFAIAAQETAASVFVDATVGAGIIYSVPAMPPALSEYAVAQTGGAAVGDFDNDGWPDLFVSRYWDAPVLYRNNRDGTFADVTASAFASATPAASSNGGAWGDIDNDGDSDLYVTSLNQRNYLYINDGAGHFAEQGIERGGHLGEPPVSGTSVSMGDYDNDGYLDMYAGEWRVLSNPTPPHSRLLHNRGAVQPGHFDDVTAASGTAVAPLSGQSAYGSLAFTPRFVDFDRDGHTDILVAGDSKTTKLFWNNGDGTFANGTPAIFDNLGFSDMGLAVGDVDGNGLLDWMTTDIYAPSDSTTGNRLFRNFGDRVFLESSTFSGVRDAGWGWGTEMLDYDNDQDLDIVATNGFYFSPAQQTDQIRLWANNGVGGIFTSFANVATEVGLTDTSQGRGLVTFDYDRDGDLDIFIVNNFSAPVLYRNDGGNDADWLRIEAIGTLSNRDGVGAFITVTPDLTFPDKIMVREISGSSTYLSQSESIAHFGLGPNAESIDLVTISWPATGIVQELRNIAPNQLLSVVERHPSDFNGDNVVNAADYTLWRDTLGRTVGHGTGADANGDRMIDSLDFALWKADFGAMLELSGVAGASSNTINVPTPEPGALSTALIALALFKLSPMNRGSKSDRYI